MLQQLLEGETDDVEGNYREQDAVSRSPFHIGWKNDGAEGLMIPITP